MSPLKAYILKLYVAGNTPNSMRALKTLRDILESEFKGVYALKVIDVTKKSSISRRRQNSCYSHPGQDPPSTRSPDHR